MKKSTFFAFAMILLFVQSAEAWNSDWRLYAHGKGSKQILGCTPSAHFGIMNYFEAWTFFKLGRKVGGWTIQPAFGFGVLHEEDNTFAPSLRVSTDRLFMDIEYWEGLDKLYEYMEYYHPLDEEYSLGVELEANQFTERFVDSGWRRAGVGVRLKYGGAIFTFVCSRQWSRGLEDSSWDPSTVVAVYVDMIIPNRAKK